MAEWVMLVSVVTLSVLSMLQMCVISSMARRLFDYITVDDEVSVRCGVCNFDGSSCADEFPAECPNCGLSALEPVED